MSMHNFSINWSVKSTDLQRKAENGRQHNAEWLVCLVSLFNGISTFVGYLTTKGSLLKCNNDIIQSITGITAAWDKIIRFQVTNINPFVTRKIYFYPRTGFYFRTCEDGEGWHLIPCRVNPRSEFFSQAYKNWHIIWGINLWLDWPPLARGSKFHTIHPPTKATSLPPLEQWKIWTFRFRRNNIS